MSTFEFDASANSFNTHHFHTAASTADSSQFREIHIHWRQLAHGAGVEPRDRRAPRGVEVVDVHWAACAFFAGKSHAFLYSAGIAQDSLG